MTKLHAQPVEPPPATPPVVTAPAPAPETPVVVAPPPSATDVAPPAPALEPIQPSFPTPAPAIVPEAQPAAAEPAVDPLAGNVSFKPFKGLEVKSNDGNWSLSLKLKGQFMDEIQFPTLETAPSRNYFFIRRQRLAIAGSIFTKDIKYKSEFTFAGQELNRRTAGVGGVMPASMTATPATSVEVLQQAPLLDLFLEFQQIRDLVLHIGQAKVPFGRERYLSDEALQTVDRSIADAEFNFDRDMGIELKSSDLGGLGLFKYYLGIYAAEDKNAGNNTLGVGDFGYLYFARFEVAPLGKFDESPVDFARGAPKLSIGVAYAFVQTDITSPYAVQSAGAAQPAMGRPPTVDYNFHNVTADFLFKGGGFSALGSVHYRKLADLPNNIYGRDGLGLALQLQYLFSKDVPFAIAANTSSVRGIGDDTTILERSEVGVGLGYYFYEHGLKLEAEFEHLWRDQGQPDRTTPSPLPANLSSPDNRLRIQLSFII